MKYAYIQAIVNEKALDLEGPGAIKFRSTIVDAEDDNDAYAKGGNWGDQFGYNTREETINDYVVYLGEAIL